MAASERLTRTVRTGGAWRLARFPWSGLFLLVFIAALLVLIPASVFGALADAGGDWHASTGGGRYFSDATVSQLAFAAVPFCSLLLLAEVGVFRLFVVEVRLWRARMVARGTP